MIGNTPLVLLPWFSHKYKNNFYAKFESWNLTGSVKDRAALGMIEQAEKDGLLDKESVIVESSSGNLGAAIAAIAAIKGYRVICVVDTRTSISKISLIKAYGAEVVMVNKKDKRGSFIQNRIAKVDELVKTIPHAFNLNQYTNINNPKAHFRTTGPEIYQDLKGSIDMVVGSVSTSGTMVGIARFLKSKDKKIQAAGIEPQGSILFGGVYKPYLQQGAGIGFVPANYDPSVFDFKLKVEDFNAFTTCHTLAKREGLLVGGSSGAALYGAIELSKKLRDKNIVVIMPDTGMNYLDTIYLKEWFNSHFKSG